MLALAVFMAAAARAVPVDWPRACGAPEQTVVSARGAAELAPLWHKYDSEPRFDGPSTTFRNNFTLAACSDGADALCMTSPDVHDGYDGAGVYTAMVLSLDAASIDVSSIAVGTEVQVAYTAKARLTESQARVNIPYFGTPHWIVMGAHSGAPYLGGAGLLYGPGVPEIVFYGDVPHPVLIALPFTLHGETQVTCRGPQLLHNDVCDGRIANRSAAGDFERLHIDVVFTVVEEGRVAVTRAHVDSDESRAIFAQVEFPNATSVSSIDGDTQPYIALVTRVSGLALESVHVRVRAPTCPSSASAASVPTTHAPTAATTTTAPPSPPSTTSAQTTSSAGRTAAPAVRDAAPAEVSAAWLPYAFVGAVVCCALLACVLLHARIARTHAWRVLYASTPDAVRTCVCCTSLSSDADGSGESGSDVSPPSTPEPLATVEPLQRASNSEYTALPIYDNAGHGAPQAGHAYDIVSEQELRAANVDYDRFILPPPPPAAPVRADTNYTDCTDTLV